MFKSTQNLETNTMLGPVFGFPGSFESYLTIEEYQAIPPPSIQFPLAIGSSVVGMKFEGGVMIAADTLISYGALARFNDVPRVFKVNERIVIAGGSDFADFQFVKSLIDSKIMENQSYFDKETIGPRSLFTWLRHIFYQRRCQMKPYMTELVIAGLNKDNTFFLGTIDLLGTAFTSDIISTGFGKHLIVPLIHDGKPEGRMYTREEASGMLHKSLEVLFYRDSRSCPRYTYAICTKNSCEVLGPTAIDQNWLTGYMVKGY